MNNITSLLKTLYSIYYPQSTKRTSNITFISESLLNTEILFEIKLLELSGGTYWNKCLIQKGMNKRLGYPCNDDKTCIQMFNKCLKNVSNQYKELNRHNFSFVLKDNQANLIKIKILSK